VALTEQMSDNWNLRQ